MTNWPNDEDEKSDNAAIYNIPYVRKPDAAVNKPVHVRPMQKAADWNSGQFNGLADILKNLGVDNLQEAVERERDKK